MTDPTTPTPDEIARDIDTYRRWDSGRTWQKDYPSAFDAHDALRRVLDAVPRLLALVAAQAEQNAELRAEVERLSMANRVAIDASWRMQERAGKAEAELAALHATDDYQRWARVVAERDAAREAVVRVRAVHMGWHVCANMANLGATDYSDDPEDGLQVCPTIAALDPEPPR